MTGDGPRTVQAVERALDILEYLRRDGPARLTEIAETFDLSPGGAHNQLATMAERGWVTREGSKYALSNRLVTFGERVRNRSTVYAAGWEEIDRLAAETDEKAHLVVESGGMAVTLYEAFGVDSVGKQYFIENRGRERTELHCTSSGKAILAHLPAERADAIVEQSDLTEYTDRTITSREALEAELETVRERGVAFNDEEQLGGFRAVSAPILDEPEDRVLGAVGVGGPASRFDDEYFEGELAEQVRETANIIQINIQTGDYVRID